MGFVALQIDGGKVEIAAEGRAQGDMPLRADALFEIGSITKTFTALLLADAVLRKRFALDEPVENALPGVRLRDVADAPIRWIDLATHRSGLPRLPANMAPLEQTDPYADYDEKRLLDFLRGYKPTVARDTRWEYSNLGFGLLGYALGRVEGRGYPTLLQERVLGPLGMQRTVLALPGRTIDGLVDGHDAKGNVAPHWHLDVLMGAGALVMPASDLALYARAALTPTSSPLGPAFELAQRAHCGRAVTNEPDRPGLDPRAAQWPHRAHARRRHCRLLVVRSGSIRSGSGCEAPCLPMRRSRSTTWRCICSTTACR